jgi:hypothetical protein
MKAKADHMAALPHLQPGAALNFTTCLAYQREYFQFSMMLESVLTGAFFFPVRPGGQMP